MNILFSPVGTADPITQLGDGPMLHIVRHYKPERIFLFLSPKMCKLEREDRRYERAIELLAQDVGQYRPQVELIESNVEEVHRFDSFIGVFEEELNRIRKECLGKSSTGSLLVNASSGTPAMEQALVALGAFGWTPLKVIQVATPRHDSSEKEDRENPSTYDLDTLWELNPDNESGRPRRTEEVELPNFRERLLRESVISLVESYDYEAALKLISKSDTFPVQARNRIKAMRDRLNLSRGTSEAEMLSNGLLLLVARMRQGHWADFVRFLTPVLTATVERQLERQEGEPLPRARYLIKEGDRYTDKLNVHSIGEDGKLSRILQKNIQGKEPHFITNRSLSDLVDEYCSAGKEKSLVRGLVRFEKKASRNEFAHRLTPADKERIESSGGMSFEEVIEALFKLNDEELGKIDNFNHGILSLIKKGQ